MPKARKWGARLSGMVYAVEHEFLRPISEAEFRRYLLKYWYRGRKRLPAHTEVWPKR